MKRWMVLLIIFSVMGGWIVLSGCNDTTITDEDVAACVICGGACAVDYTTSCVESCFTTCFTCSWIGNMKCTGNPIQDCIDAFTSACMESQSENFSGPPSCSDIEVNE